MKKIYLIVLFISFNLFCFGQSKVTWEIFNVGIGTGFSKDSQNRNVEDGTSLSFGTSVWINPLNSNNLSTGIDFSFTGWNRENSGLNQKSFFTIVFADYNFYLNKIRLFSGAGIGYSAVVENEGGYSERKITSGIALAPRIGLQYKRVKLTSQYNYQGNDNNFLNIKIGYCIPFY